MSITSSEGAHQAVAVGCDERQGARLLGGGDPEEGAALGRAQPLVQVGGVEVGAQGGNVQRSCPHCMRPIQQHYTRGTLINVYFCNFTCDS